jgi:hypothetical protein
VQCIGGGRGSGGRGGSSDGGAAEPARPARHRQATPA